MGWFDKKSWQLRRKIKDLQSELAVAERDGKYVISQGLFFAELQEMGDNTMMVLGAADQLDSGEEDVIRNFFERNGFSVEVLRLDRTHKSLAAVEIIPPEELTKHVARGLQEQDYRLIDDSEFERTPDLDKKTVTLSSLLRTITTLFASHVHQLIISTPIKLNMEGNRLLHWMPLIRDAELAKAPARLLPLCVEPFIDGYNHYYGQFGKIENPDSLRDLARSTAENAAEPVATATSASTQVPTEFSEVTPPGGSTSWSRPAVSTATASSPAPLTAKNRTTPVSPERDAAAARTLAHMYRSLIGASEQRKVRNSTALLDDIVRFFEANSACILTRTSSDAPLMLHANSGSGFCLSTADNGAVNCESEVIDQALETGKIAFSQHRGNGNKNVESVAVPLNLDGSMTAILYVVEPEGFSAAAESPDAQYLIEFARIFREYPDLLI